MRQLTYARLSLLLCLAAFEAHLNHTGMEVVKQSEQTEQCKFRVPSACSFGTEASLAQLHSSHVKP